jgi:hypothetical protein
MKRFILILLILVFLPVTAAYASGSKDSSGLNPDSPPMSDWLKNFGNTINNSFFFVADKLIDLQAYFKKVAMGIGRIVLLIAVLSAALNYALTGQGLKENVIKIMKATIFFLVVILAYPKIIGYISSMAYELAYKSIYPSVSKYFKYVETETETRGHNFTFAIMTKEIVTDYSHLFPDLTKTRKHPQMDYTTIAPAAVINLIFVLAGECFTYADTKSKGKVIPEFSRILKGLICAFFIIFTGIFALLEYVICFLEFMLVASVGVILFPLSIWEGSKFLSEKFIGAIIGFFIKLLFCNIVIFFLIYGFVSLFHVLYVVNGFNGTPDQIVFIIFVCLLFFYICKSAPGIAQGLLTGVPSLSATGAISAAGGAIAAAGATMGMAKAAGGKLAGGIAKTGVSVHGTLSEASAAAGAVRDAGGSKSDQRGAFMSSITGSAKDAISAGGLGLARSLLGAKDTGMNPHSWREAFNKGVNKDGDQIKYSEHIAARKEEGARRGLAYMNKQEDKKDAGNT